MSAINNGLKAVACGLGALAITTVMSWSFVESTSSAPFANLANAANPTAQVAKLANQPRHVWFGQSQPAVLVD
jgi:hypothetical protein